jgi:N-acetylmuramoyl-L-alanine amidase
MQGTIDWFMNPESHVSSHFVIDRNGDICQCVSLDSIAWHCGRSLWKGISNLNPLSIGIELCNWGPLRKDKKNGLYYPWHCDGNTVQIPAARVEAAPLTRADTIYCYWEKYPARQLFSLALLLHSLCRSYEILDVMAHSEIAPDRKVDPGPVFPLQLIKDYAKIATRLDT